jgi:hypothetical protein
MADSDDVFTSVNPIGEGRPLPAKPQAEARRSGTTKAGAPQDTPHKEFLVGPNAGASTRDFFDDAQSHDTIPLGKGNSGIVHVWVCVDQNNNIVDRVVVKQCVPGFRYYNDPNNWSNGQVGGEPMESVIACAVHGQLYLNNPDDEKFVAECLGYGDCQHQSPNLPQYKLYYEYLLGDLPGCIEAQWRTTKLVKPSGKMKRKRVVQEQKPFPEGFLWAVSNSVYTQFLSSILLITVLAIRVTRQNCCCYGCSGNRPWVSRVSRSSYKAFSERESETFSLLYPFPGSLRSVLYLVTR